MKPDSPHGLSSLFGDDVNSPSKRSVAKPAPSTDRADAPAAKSAASASSPSPAKLEDPNPFRAQPEMSQPARTKKADTPPARRPRPKRAEKPTATPAPPQQRSAAIRPAEPQTAPARPDLAFIIPVGDNTARVARIFNALKEQTVVGRTEIIAIGSCEIAAASALTLDDGDIHFVKTPDASISGRAIADAVGVAKAPLVAILDWYATPARDFAALVLADEDKEWDALAPRQVNSNPLSGASWAAMLPDTMAIHGRPSGPIKTITTITNTVWRRSSLLQFGPELAQLIDDGTLVDAITAKGGVLYRNREAQLASLNPSKRSAVNRMRFLTGRLEAARSMESGKWALPRRILAAANNFLFPYFRYYRNKSKIFGGRDVATLSKGHRGVVLMGFIYESFGRGVGYLRGAGNARAKLELMSRNRFDGLNREDFRRFNAENSPR
ncbi:hypothetical protein [Parvularcula sp. LCG005]|uniref:hypothetical protein n=1 Tax=Parvularcula sp. LCG005 TaxID=3078805 RepID=UPI002942467D|nr:hypothetical protein [Parvularcula sp. LCG005]WOI54525.1 hypothetical protein RUI03_05890 [Parvularcula sp. LCG005]